MFACTSHVYTNRIRRNETLMAPADELVRVPEASREGRETPSVVPYLTDMENSPGALSLSRTRKAPHSRCLSRLSATLRDIRPANQLEEEEEERLRSQQICIQSLLTAQNKRGDGEVKIERGEQLK